MFEGFVEERVDGDGCEVFVRHCGQGPAVLLLHGHPRTSSTWHRVAPQLVARGLTVVCADLPGYGRSGKPTPTADHGAHSNRTGARQLLGAMRALGHERFAVVGHDRGSYYALRMALDHPGHVTLAALLDCCRSVNIWTARMRASRPRGGTGSSSPNPSFPSGSSSPTRTRGTAAIPK